MCRLVDYSKPVEWPDYPDGRWAAQCVETALTRCTTTEGTNIYFNAATEFLFSTFHNQ